MANDVTFSSRNAVGDSFHFFFSLFCFSRRIVYDKMVYLDDQHDM